MDDFIINSEDESNSRSKSISSSSDEEAFDGFI